MIFLRTSLNTWNIGFQLPLVNDQGTVKWVSGLDLTSYRFLCTGFAIGFEFQSKALVA